MRNITYHFLVGLPGSGKTTYAMRNISYSFNKRTNTHTIYVSLDDYMKSTIEEAVESLFMSHPSIDNHIAGRIWNDTNVIMYIDGVTSYTKENFEMLLKVVMKCTESVTPKRFQATYDIVVEQWNLDRERCIYNDKLRVKYGERDNHSEATIKATPYEMADLSDLKEMIKSYDSIKNISIMNHTVYKSNAYDVLFAPKEAYIRNGDEWQKAPVMKSDSWATGGTWCDCWGNTNSITPAAQPIFNEFIELLEKVSPRMSFLEYRKIESECVSTEDFAEYDYYGGREERRRWVCDLRKMYEMLKEMRYINENE